MTSLGNLFCPDLFPHAVMQLGAINPASRVTGSHILKSHFQRVCMAGCDCCTHHGHNQPSRAIHFLSFFIKFSQYFICKFNITCISLLHLATQPSFDSSVKGSLEFLIPDKNAMGTWYTH